MSLCHSPKRRHAVFRGKTNCFLLASAQWVINFFNIGHTQLCLIDTISHINDAPRAFYRLRRGIAGPVDLVGTNVQIKILTVITEAGINMYFFGIVSEDINTLIEVTTPSPNVCAF
ncbi:TPA: hypothetical protein ACJIYA_005479, partial [Klebsiella pneumoniae]